MRKTPKPKIVIDLESFLIDLNIPEKDIDLTLSFKGTANRTPRRFYLALIALLIYQMKGRGKLVPVPLDEYIDDLVLLDERLSGKDKSETVDLLYNKITRNWIHRLPYLMVGNRLCEPIHREVYRDDSRKKSEDEITEDEKATWKKLFGISGSGKEASLKFALDKIDLALDDVSITFGPDDGHSEHAWERFRSNLAQDAELQVGAFFTKRHSALEEEVISFLRATETRFTPLKPLLSDKPIAGHELYVPVSVSYKHRSGDLPSRLPQYTESAAALKRMYAFKRLPELALPSRVPWQKVRAESRLMVLADPGMGKSTLLRLEAFEAARQAREFLQARTLSIHDIVIPIQLSFQDLNQNLQSTNQGIFSALLNLIYEEYFDASDALRRFLREHLATGKCKLLLDCLDLIPSRLRNQLSRKLNSFADHFKGNIVCTSRITGYIGSFLAGAKEVEILPFSDPQIALYVTLWTKLFPAPSNGLPTQPYDFTAFLVDTPEIRGLAQVPLLLSFLCSLNYEGIELTSMRKVELYGFVLDHILGHSIQNRSAESEAILIAQKRLLGELAYYFSDLGQTVFSSEELTDFIEEYLKREDCPSDIKRHTADSIITELADEHGIILETERLKKHYTFLHLSFQEYLTASHLNTKFRRSPDESIAIARSHFWDFEWHEIVVLFAGLLRNPDLLLETIILERDDIFYSMLLLVGKCAVQCNSKSSHLRPRIVRLIYELFASCPEAPHIRSNAAMCAKFSSEILEWIEQDLTGETWVDTEDPYFLLYTLYLREQTALNFLEAVGNRKAVDILGRFLKDRYNSQFLRRLAAEALGRLRNPLGVDAIINTFKDHSEDTDLRECMILSLSGVSDKKAVALLVNILKDKKAKYFFRFSSIFALGATGTPHAIKALVWALRCDNKKLANNALLALAAYGHEMPVALALKELKANRFPINLSILDALAKSRSEGIVEFLLEALANGKGFIRKAAAKNLSELCDKLAFSALEKSARDDTVTAVRLYSKIAITAMGDNRFSAEIVEILRKSKPKFRIAAATALGKLRRELAIKPLSEALRDSNLDVRAAAINALGQLGGEEAANALVDLLKGGNLIDLAAVALANIGSFAILEKIFAVRELEISNPYVLTCLRALVLRYKKELIVKRRYPLRPELIPCCKKRVNSDWLHLNVRKFRRSW